MCVIQRLLVRVHCTFPSNYWSNEDAHSPTGLRLSISDDVVSQNILAELPVQEGFSPASLFNGNSGFSAGTPVIFEFNSTPDADTLPADGGSAIITIDMNTGEQLEVRAQVIDYAQSDRVSSVSDVIEIFHALIGLRPRHTCRDNQRLRPCRA